MTVDCAIPASIRMGRASMITSAMVSALPNDATGAGCARTRSADGGLGYPCAFGGINSQQNAALFLKPVGRSVYNALQMKLVNNVNNPFRGVKAMNFQVAYSFSNFSNTGGAPVDGYSSRQRPGLCSGCCR